MHNTETYLTSITDRDSHVPADIFSYITEFPDQDVTIDQRDPLYAYKGISDPDTMNLHEAMNASD